MRERKWTDCPVCGAKGTMQRKTDVRETVTPHGGYPPVTVEGLDGHYCTECGEGFLTSRAQRKRARILAEHMALHDSQRTPVSEVATVDEARRVLDVTRQAVNNMMREGRLRYVYLSGKRLPLRKALVRRKRPAALR